MLVRTTLPQGILTRALPVLVYPYGFFDHSALRAGDVAMQRLYLWTLHLSMIIGWATATVELL